MTFYKEYAKKQYSPLVNDKTLSPHNTLPFTKNLLQISISGKIKTIINEIEQN